MLSGCASPVPESGAGGASPADSLRSPAADNPFRDPADVASREEAIARFFGARGIALAAHAEAGWVALGGEAAIVVTIRNEGSREVTVVGERTRGFWPFSTTEHARALLHVSARTSAPRSGVRTVQDALPFERIETLRVPPGSERSLRLPLELPLPLDTECAVAVVRPVLHPLAVIVGDEPERVITLRFPEVRVSFGPAAVAAAAPDDEAPLERALAGRPDEVVAAAVRLAERDPVQAVDRLVVALPGPDPRARRARLVALEWITGVRLGGSVERWRSWWESDAGTDFARRERP